MEKGPVNDSIDSYQRALHRYLDRVDARKRTVGLVVVYSIVVGCFGIYIDVYYGGRAAPYVLPEASLGMFIMGLLLATLPSVWMPTEFDRPSALLYWGLYLLAYTPAVFLTLLKLGGRAIEFSVVLLFCMAILVVPFHVSRLDLPRMGLTERTFWTGMVIAFLGFLAFIAVTVGHTFELPTNMAVYDIRAEYKAALDSLHPLVERFTVYAVDWMYLVLSPVFFVVGYVRGDWWKAGLGLFGFLLVFSLTGYKTALFIPLTIVLLSFVLQTAREYTLSYGLIGLSTSLIGTTVLNSVTGVILPASLLRRLIVIPGLLTAIYYDFFSTHPLTYFSDRFWGRLFFEYPYEMPVPNLIGETYFNDATTHANANLWAEGFAALGYPGLIIFTGILAAGFWWYDSVAARVDSHERLLFLTGYVFIVINGDVISLFATNGFALFLIVVYCYSLARPWAGEGSLADVL